MENDPSKFPARAYTNPGPMVEFEGEPWYEVEAIIAAKARKNKSNLYQIRWKGWGPEHDTWEPEENVGKEKVEEYLWYHGQPKLTMSTRTEPTRSESSISAHSDDRSESPPKRHKHRHYRHRHRRYSRK